MVQPKGNDCEAVAIASETDNAAFLKPRDGVRKQLFVCLLRADLSCSGQSVRDRA